MDTIRRLNANFLERITHDEVLTRSGELAWEALNAFITGYSGARSGLLFGNIVNVAGQMKVKLNEGSFFIHRVETTKCIGIAQRKEIIVDVDPETTGDPRKDTLKGRWVSTTNRPKTVDVINELNGEVNPLPKDTDVEYELELAVEKGTPAVNPNPPELPSASASYTSPVDLSSPVDTTFFSKISLSVNGSAFVDIDMQGVNPVSTSITEMVNAINASYAGLATDDGTYITLTATGTGDSIRFQAPADSDATFYIFGLDLSPDYLYKFERQYPWFKIAELWVAANESTELQQEEIIAPDRQKLWTDPADPNDENDAFATPNVEELTEISVPVGSIVAINKNLKSDLNPSQDFWAFCGVDGDKPSNWSGSYLVQGDSLPTDKFSGGNVPNLSNDIFLMGAAGASQASGGINTSTTGTVGSTTWTGSGTKPNGSGIVNMNHNHLWNGFRTTAPDTPNGLTTGSMGVNKASFSWIWDGVTTFDYPNVAGQEIENACWTSRIYNNTTPGPVNGDLDIDPSVDFSHNHSIGGATTENRPSFITVHYFMRIA